MRERRKKYFAKKKIFWLCQFVKMKRCDGKLNMYLEVVLRDFFCWDEFAKQIVRFNSDVTPWHHSQMTPTYPIKTSWTIPIWINKRKKKPQKQSLNMSLTSWRRKKKAPLSARDWSFLRFIKEKKSKKKKSLRTKFNFLFQVFFLLLILSRTAFSRDEFFVWALLVYWGPEKAFDVYMRCVCLLIHHTRSATFWLVWNFFLMTQQT